jgi:hypothetical protein
MGTRRLRRGLLVRLAADPAGVIGDWGAPMSDRMRAVVLSVILGVWVVVCAAYLFQDELPDAKLLTVPIGAIIALRWRSKDDKTEEGGDDEDAA